MSAVTVDEWLHLAAHAGSVGDQEACITYLKTALRQEPNHANARYLLSLQHAELGLVDRAVDGLKAALALAPALEFARLQLGTLLLSTGRQVEAKEQLGQLSSSTSRAVQIYADAMLALANNNFAAAREKLALGLAQPSVNRTFGPLMQRMLNQLAHAPDADQHEEIPLGAYGQRSSGEQSR